MSARMIIGLDLASLAVPFVLPLNYVRLIPLVSSTLALQWWIDEYQFFSSWTKLPPSARSSADPVTTPQSKPNDIALRRNATLAEWFTQWLPQGALCPAISNPLCWSSTIVTSYHLQKFPSVQRWFLAGLALYFLHIPFGRREYADYMRIGEGGEDGSSMGNLERWLKMHKWRIWLIDVPGWICFAVGTVKAIEYQK